MHDPDTRGTTALGHSKLIFQMGKQSSKHECFPGSTTSQQPWWGLGSTASHLGVIPEYINSQAEGAAKPTTKAGSGADITNTSRVLYLADITNAPPGAFPWPICCGPQNCPAKWLEEDFPGHSCSICLRLQRSLTLCRGYYGANVTPGGPQG